MLPPHFDLTSASSDGSIEQFHMNLNSQCNDSIFLLLGKQAWTAWNGRELPQIMGVYLKEWGAGTDVYLFFPFKA